MRLKNYFNLVAVALSVTLSFSLGAIAGEASSSTSADVRAQDQSRKPTDADLTREIRKELMARDLSMAAKNVSIITIDGIVTLKGNVPSPHERNVIGQIANGLAPNVRNDIVVK